MKEKLFVYLFKVYSIYLVLYYNIYFYLYKHLLKAAFPIDVKRADYISLEFDNIKLREGYKKRNTVRVSVSLLLEHD